MLVQVVEADPLRSLSAVRLDLSPGINAITGPNGAGKTNLIEALYFGLTGRSFRTADRRELIPHGGNLARARVVVVDRDGIERQFLASVTRSEGRRHLLDGENATAAVAAHHRPHLAVFSPDRLHIIKGPPAERRAHLDTFIAARWPSRAELRSRFGQVLAQRNAMLARVASGQAAPGSLDPWDQTFAEIAARLSQARAEAVGEITGPFGEIAQSLGLPGPAGLSYAPRAAVDAAELLEGLSERRQTDLELGRSSWGPQLDEVKLEINGRSLRRYGSQGQQRSGLLALLFAERDALAAAHAVTPMLLLDDVMSELDPEHRELLGEHLAAGGQSVITAADRQALPSLAQKSGFEFVRPGELRRMEES